MEKLNIFVNVIGEFEKVNKYLSLNKIFNSIENEDTLYVYVVKSSDIEKIKPTKGNFVVFTDGFCNFPHMKCTDLEVQVVYALETMLSLSYTGIVNLNIGEVIKNITKSNEFYFLSVSNACISLAMDECVNTIIKDEFTKCEKAFINITINMEAEYLDIKYALEYFYTQVSVNDDVILGKTLNRSLTEKVVSIILVK